MHQRKGRSGRAPGVLQNELQDVMWDHVGPFRTGAGLETAVAAIRNIRMELHDTTLAPEDVFNMDVQDWYELKAMLSTADAVVTSALNRSESRGAHQRLDIPHIVAEFEKNQFVSLDRGALSVRWQSVHHSEVRSA